MFPFQNKEEKTEKNKKTKTTGVKMETDCNIDINDYQEYIGIDPGVKNTLALVRREKDGKREENLIIKSKDTHCASRKRNKKQQKKTSKYDKMIMKYLKRNYRDPKQLPSSKSTDYFKLVDFKLKFYKTGTECYMRRKITHFKFRKYISNQKVLNSLCEKVNSTILNNTDIYLIVSHSYQLFFSGLWKRHRKRKKNYIHRQPWKKPHERLC